jgi:uncharacterized membrane protein
VLSAAEFLTGAERELVERAIVEAEQRTSGEIRVHFEDHIEEEVLDHAAFIFEELAMHRTRDRNAVLIYISVVDRKVAVIGDKGINEVVPAGFWNDVVGVLQLYFAGGKRADGLVEAVHLVGAKLRHFFPLRNDDRNELSNTITFSER